MTYRNPVLGTLCTGLDEEGYATRVSEAVTSREITSLVVRVFAFPLYVHGLIRKKQVQRLSAWETIFRANKRNYSIY